MSEAPEQQQPSDSQPSRRWLWWRNLQATATRRALLLTALGGLLIAGVTTALPAGANDAGRLVGHSNAVPEANRASQAFDNARPGDCLNWPNKEPDQATVVDCKDEHRFEVATSVDMRMFPGSEYGPNAAAPSAARVQQISQEQCQAAVKRYLGTKYDPNSKFTIGMLWSGAKAWSAGDRQMLCGLQLPGGGNEEQQAVKGRVADLDQSKVWQAGTCLGIDTAANQPTDIPIDCAGPHAMEVTGSVNVAEKFPGGALPPEADQDAYIKDTCTRMTDAYLAPVELRTTTLTLVYSTVSLPSWSAGSHQVSCSIGATLGNGGWATLVGSAKGALLINGQPPVPPPDIPAERLNIPPIADADADADADDDRHVRLAVAAAAADVVADQCCADDRQPAPAERTGPADRRLSGPRRPRRVAGSGSAPATGTGRAATVRCAAARAGADPAAGSRRTATAAGVAAWPCG